MTLVSIPANPVPEGAFAGTIKTPDGVELRYARFAPPPGRKGTLVLVNGRAEFIEKYFEVIEDARARGFAGDAFVSRAQAVSTHPLRARRKGHIRDLPGYEPARAPLVRGLV